MSSYTRKRVPVPTATLSVGDSPVSNRWSDQSSGGERKRTISQMASSNLSLRSLGSKVDHGARKGEGAVVTTAVISAPVVNISHSQNNSIDESRNKQLADELDYITVSSPNHPPPSSPPLVLDAAAASTALTAIQRSDKASRILGIQHRRSMEPIPASRQGSIASTQSAREAVPPPAFTPSLPLTSLYVVSGLPKSPHTWTLADPDSVLGLHHSDSAVNRWWRPEVLGSTISPGAGGGQKKKKKHSKHDEIMKGAGALSKQEVGKMLSKALKVSPFPMLRVHQPKKSCLTRP